MKLPILTAFAVLALNGAAMAQPAPAPMASDFDGVTSRQAAIERAAQVHDQATQEMLRSVQNVSSRMHLACAADRARLCADSRTAFRADRCLEGHRRDVTEPCRAALTQAAMAWNNPR
jgi:hypothetical protein